METTNRKKILFLSHYFPPELNAPASRTIEHCRIWAKDHAVTVVTNFPNHPDGKIFPGYKNRQTKKEIVDGINVVRVLTLPSSGEGFFFRTLNYIWYMIASVLYVVFSQVEFDVIIATTPQFFCGMAGKILKKITHKPFILELRDFWPESIVAVGAIKNRRLIEFLEHREQKLYESADKIITVTRSFKEALIKRNIPPSRIETVFNGISLDLFSTYSPISNPDIKTFLSAGYNVGYIGTIGMAHSLKTLVDAADKMKDTDIRFVIIGSGAERVNIENEIKNRKLKNIKIFPAQQKTQVPAILNTFNIFIIHLKKHNLFKTVIPSKIFEGMIMERPILIGVDGEARKIIEDAKCGIYFEPENTDDLIDKINRLKSDPVAAAEMGRNGYRFVKDNFNRERLAQYYLRLILSVIDDSI